MTMSIELVFAICHVLRELGFHKESSTYFVKSKGKRLKVFKMNENNIWSFKHRDFNGYSRFVPSMGNIGESIFQEYDYEGYICTCPSMYQLKDFCMRKAIPIRDFLSPKSVLEDLIYEYRIKSKQYNAFRKYLEL